jgi:hypothetical protein
MHQLSAAVFAVMLIGLSSASNPGAERDVVLTFLGGAEPMLENYEAYRTLIGSSEGSKREGRLDVRTEFDRTARTLRYAILAEEGSALIRHRGLEAVLRAEADSVTQGRMAQSALTPENYDIAFSDSDSDEMGLYRLLLHPRRTDSLLVQGAMFVTSTGDLRKVEGHWPRIRRSGRRESM